MIRRDLEAEILRLHHVEKWKVGTIAEQLGVHHDVVHRVLSQEGMPRSQPQRPSRLDPYLPFILETLDRYPRLTASRLYDMCRERGFRGSPDHFRHMVARHRPARPKEAFLRMSVLPGQQGQVDWAHFGKIQIGRAVRALMAFVMVLAYSRRIFLRFYLDQRSSNFLRGHADAFVAFGGIPRVLLYDNLKSAVLERRGDAILFNPLLVDFARHHLYEIRPVAVARGNEKGRVERAIRYVRTSFWPARSWRDLDDLNAQAAEWCDSHAMERAWPDDRSRTVADAFAEEQPLLMALPETSYPTEEQVQVRVGKTPHLRFDGNEYSVPHELVRRTLELRASLDQVRILHEGRVVAEHARCFDRGRVIEDLAHVHGLRKAKGELRSHRAIDRLAQAAPSSQQLFVRIAEQGHNLGRATQLIVQLLDQYGAVRLEQAIREALASGTHSHHALRHILERLRHGAGLPPAVPPRLPDDPRVRDLAVRPPRLDGYDALLHRDEESGPASGKEGGDVPAV
jgi:transposase